MEKYNSFQHKILKAISDQQKAAVEIALWNYKEGDNIEDLLYNTTFECLIGVMTLIDGYADDSICLDIIDRNTKERLKENPFIELHDSLCDYLQDEGSKNVKDEKK